MDTMKHILMVYPLPFIVRFSVPFHSILPHFVPFRFSNRVHYLWSFEYDQFVITEMDAEDGDSQQMLGGDGHDNWNHDGIQWHVSVHCNKRKIAYKKLYCIYYYLWSIFRRRTWYGSKRGRGRTTAQRKRRWSELDNLSIVCLSSFAVIVWKLSVRLHRVVVFCSLYCWVLSIVEVIELRSDLWLK